jgi:hypothetical protein
MLYPPTALSFNGSLLVQRRSPPRTHYPVGTCEGNVKAKQTYAAADKVATLCSVDVKTRVPICAQSPKDARFGTVLY